MIETQHSVAIDTTIDRVWDYVKDISRWASVFPGCRECTIIDDNNSRWVIKVGAGGLVRTVNVLVNVEQWNGPGEVLFSYKLEAEPVVGRGSYAAVSKGANETEIILKVIVEGSGQMAPMWEAMSRPLLPQLAKMFAGSLKTEIEAIAGVPPVEKPSLFVAIDLWLRKIWRAMFGPKNPG